MITYCYSLQKMFGSFVGLAISGIDQQGGSIVNVLRSGGGEITVGKEEEVS